MGGREREGGGGESWDLRRKVRLLGQTAMSREDGLEVCADVGDVKQEK